MSKTRMGKRVASLLLSLVMMLSLLPTTVYATEGADTGDITDEIVGQANTSVANTEGTGEPGSTGEGKDGGEAGNNTEGTGELKPTGEDKDGSEDEQPDGADNMTSSAAAEVNGTGYETLAAAINAANTGDTVRLLTDCELTAMLTISGSKAFTLDLNGHNIINKELTALKLDGSTNMTVQDTSETASGMLSGGYIGIFVTEKATLTVKSGTVKGGTNAVTNSGTVNIEGTANLQRDIGEGVYCNSGSITNMTDGTVFDIGPILTMNEKPNVTVKISGGEVKNYAYATEVTGGKIKDLTLITGCDIRGAEITDSIQWLNGDVPTLTDVTLGENATVRNEGYCFNSKKTAIVHSVAKIDNTEYATLKEAINAANTSDTITLLVDVDLGSSKIGFYKTGCENLTFDLNGHKITSAIQNNGTVVASRVGLVIKNGTIENTAASTKHGAIYATFSTKGTHSLTLENVTVIAKDKGIYTTMANGNATVTIGDKTVINAKTGIDVVGPMSDSQTCAGSLTLNVSGGTVTGTECGIHVKGPDKKHATAAVTVNVTGGEVSSITTDSKPSDLQTKVDISGGTVTGDLKNSGKDVITISGGTFKGTVKNLGDGSITITGGTFATKPNETYLADGYVFATNGDGTYGVTAGTVYVAAIGEDKYTSLQAAIDKAGRNATVKLLADTKENVTISTPYLTLDLNGFTLNGSTGERKPALTITARVTVMDSSEAKTGTIMREDTAENSGVSSHYVIDIQDAGWLTFEGGTVKNNSGNTEGKGASLVRVGDDSVAKYPGLNIKGGKFTQDNFIVIKVDRGDLFLNGGTLNSANSYAIEDWHRATIKGGTVNGTVAAWTYSGGLNSSLEISGGTINGDVTSVNYGNAEGKKATVTIKGGAITGELDTRSYDPTTGNLTSITDAAKATIEITGGTFKNDPTKYVVEDSAVTPNADGTFGVEKAYLAKVGNTSYYTMEEAFKAQTASGEPIVMLRDYTTGSSFWSGSIDRTVELGGHTWTCTGTDANSAAFEINYPNASLTVKNGKIVSSQLVGLIPSASGGTYTYDNSSLTFENVKMSTTATSGIETNGNNTNDTVTLKDSTLDVPNGFGIYFPSSGKLTIENSTINAKTMGVQVCAGSLNITGDKTAINVTGDPVPKTENDGAIQDGAAISIVNRTGYKGLGNVTVTGGTFKANGTNAAIKAYDWDNTNNVEKTFTANDKVFVSGGTFSSIPDNMDGLCKDGFVPVKNADGYAVQTGTYVASIGTKKFATLAEAVEAAKDGDAVKLLGDVVLAETLIIKDKTITLDLNGRTISNSADIWNESKYAWSLISVRDNGDLTINDTAGGGTLKAKENDCYALDVQDKDTALTVNAGTYVGNISAIYAYDGKVTINGGHFSIQQKKDDGDPYRFTLNCYDSNYKADSAGFTVNGGTFENFDPRNNKAEGAGTSFVAEGVGVNNENGNFVAKANMLVQLVDAEGNSVAAYDNLDYAFYHAQDEKNPTLIVLQDIVDSDPVSITATNTTDSITLDLNGHNISFVENEWSAIWSGFNIQNAAALDLIITGKGTITAAASNVAAICVQGLNLSTRTTLTIDEDVTVVASTGVLIDMYRADGQASCGDNITVNIAGTVKNTSESEDYAISVNGEITKQQPTINVMSTAKIEANGWGMYLAGNNKTNIASGAQISGTVTGIEIRAGELTLDGCTVTGGNGELTATANGNGATVRNAAIAVSQHATELPITVNIKSGTYTGTAAVYQSDAQGTASENVKVSIENGTFLGKVEAKTAGAIAISGGAFTMNVDKYCAEGCTCTEPTDDDPMYYVVKADEEQINVKRSLTLGNTLIMNYKVLLPEGYTNPHIVFESYDAKAGAFYSVPVTDCTLQTKGEETRYVFAFTETNPQRMTDTLKATVYATKGETEKAFPIDDYSVANYCNALLASDANKNGAYDELVGNLVAYGTAAQLYQNYHTDKLVKDVVNGGTAVTYPISEAVEVNNLNKVNGGVVIETKSLVLNNAFAIRVKFTLEDNTTIDQVKFTVAVDGKTTTIGSESFHEGTLSNGTSCYYFDFADLNSRQLDSTVTFTAVVDDTNNDVLEFSANTYLKLMAAREGVSTKLMNLLTTLYSYGCTCGEFK